MRIEQRMVRVWPRFVVLVWCILCTLGEAESPAQEPGTPDTTFNAVGSSFSGLPEIVYGLPDGKILVAGSFTAFKGVPKNGILRLNADGSLDNSFDAGNGAIGGSINVIAVQADGKILVGGAFGSFNTSSRAGLARLNIDGSVDESFNADFAAWISQLSRMQLQPDGKLIVAGSFRFQGKDAWQAIVRLNVDGSRDDSFSADTTTSLSSFDTANGLALQPDGRILLSGSIRNTETNQSGLVRLNTDGSVDTSFRYSREITTTPSALALQPDGRILVIGATWRHRLLPSGETDPSFNFTGKTPYWPVRQLILQPDGKLLVAGIFDLPGGANFTGVIRLNRDGTNDNSFATVTSGGFKAMSLDADGKLLVCGATLISSDDVRPVFRRIFAGEATVAGAGVFQFAWTSYSVSEIAHELSVEVTRTGGSSRAATVDYRVQAGSATADADFSPVSGTVSFAAGESAKLIRIPIQNDTAIEADETFTLALTNPTGGAVLGNSASAVVTIVDDERPGRFEWKTSTVSVGEADGQIRLSLTRSGETLGTVTVDYAAVSATASVGVDFGAASGTLTFGDGENVKDVVIPISEDFIAEGPENFSVQLSNPTAGASLGSYSSATVTIVDNDAPGSRVVGFEAAAMEGKSTGVTAVELADGKLLVGDTSVLVDGVTRKLVRLNADGSLDRDFVAQLSPEARVLEILVQTDGKILLRGYSLRNENGVQQSLVRLNADGSLDAAFVPGRPSSSVVVATSMALQPDGKILVGGVFASNGGGSAIRLARLMPDGTLDPDFVISDAQGAIDVLLVQPDGRIIVAGKFSSFGGRRVAGLTRLHPSGELDEDFVLDAALQNSNAQISSLALQPDGKILVGRAIAYYASADRILLRVDSNGAIDPTFDAGTRSESFWAVHTLVLQPDGKILAGGVFTSIGGIQRTNLARLNPDGSGDPTFDAGAERRGKPLLALRNGDLLAGTMNVYRPLTRLHGGQLDSTGQAILGFGWASASIGEADGHVILQVARTGGNLDSCTVAYETRNGTALAGVDYTPSSGTLVFAPQELVKTIRIPVLDSEAADGVRTFSVALSNPSSGAELGAIATTVISVSDNEHPGRFRFETTSFLVRENTAEVELKVVRTVGRQGAVSISYATVDGSATADADYIPVSGSLTFQDGEYEKSLQIRIRTDGQAEGNEAFSVVLSDPTGGASLTSASVATIRIIDIDDPGSVIEDSTPVFQSTDRIRAMLVQPDGKVLIAGSFTLPSGFQGAVARLNVDGSFDSTFAFLTQSGVVNAIALQSDGKIIVGGNFVREDTGMRASIVRLLADGRADPSFNPAQIESFKTVYTLALQSDGKVVVGGDFTRVGNDNRPYMVRLTANGTFDSKFNPTSVDASGGVFRLAVDGADRILYADHKGQLVRLQEDGSVDPGFRPGISGTTQSRLYTFLVDEHGRILVSGAFNKIGATPRYGIARLLPDGAVDPSFDAGTFFNDPPEALALQRDERIIAAGYVHMQMRSGVARLLPDGANDPSFQMRQIEQDSGHGHFDAAVVTPDGSVLVAGTITQLDGVPQSVLARLVAGPQVGVFRFAEGNSVSALENSGELSVIVERTSAEGAVSVRYALDDGSAKAGEDFTAVSGTLQFAAGETRRSISVPLLNDSTYKPNRDFTVQLFEPTVGSAVIPSGATLQVTIKDDERRTAGVLQFTQKAFSVDENVGSAVVTVMRTGGSDDEVEVEYSTVNGTARSDADFLVTSGVLVFAHGETTRQIQIPIINHQLKEPSEYFSIHLRAVNGGATLGARKVATVTITDSGAQTLASFRGTYTGLLGSTYTGTSGMITLTVTPTGVATGTVVLEGVRHAFRGTFDGDGRLQAEIFGEGLGMLTLTLQLSIGGEQNRLTGTIVAPVQSYDLTAEHHSFSARNPAPMAGQYTLAFLPDGLSPDAPVGSGYGLVTVSRTGAVRLAGVAADGTAFAQSSTVSQEGLWAMLSTMYKGRGGIAGAVQFARGESWDVAGTATWLKPENSAGKYYRAGFTANLTISGSPLPRSHKESLLSFPQATLTFTDGDLPEASNRTVLQPRTNRFSISENPAKETLGLNPVTGLLSGRFIHPATGKAVPFKGIALPDENRATGFFLGPTTGGALQLSSQ